MKNINYQFLIVLISVCFLIISTLDNDAFGQSKSKEQTLAAFPDSMATIFNQSCVGCHYDQSTSKAKEFMNLSEWDQLNARKQAKTARQINKQVAKGHMPPPESVEKYPEEALSAVQKQTIKAWSKEIRKNKSN